MVCDLCKRDSRTGLVRVQNWQVCQWCVSNKALEQALTVAQEIARLKSVVVMTEANQQEDQDRLVAAQAHLARIQDELNAAIEIIAVLSAGDAANVQEVADSKLALNDYQHKQIKATLGAKVIAEGDTP